MPHRKSARFAKRVPAHCDLANASFDVAISDITIDGCSVEADCDWEADVDFLHLRIADRIDVNGRVLWQKGRRAGIGFFGQIHPAVIADLADAA